MIPFNKNYNINSIIINAKGSYESNSSMISHINLGMKHIGKRSAGKPHAAFEEAGAGNGVTAAALDPTTVL